MQDQEKAQQPYAAGLFLLRGSLKGV